VWCVLRKGRATEVALGAAMSLKRLSTESRLSCQAITLVSYWTDR